MAKSGQIQLDGINPGDEPLADSVVFTESTPTSLGSVVSDLLDASADGLKIMVDMAGRFLRAFALAKDDADFNNPDVDHEAVLIDTIVRDDTSKRTSPVTGTVPGGLADNDAALAAAINDAFASAKPAKNVASIVNAVEDAIAKLASQDPAITFTGNNGIRVVVDQNGDGSVKVYRLNGGTGDYNTDATAKIVQVPASTTSGPTPLPFE